MSQTIVLLNPHAAGGKAAALAEPVREWLAKQTWQQTSHIQFEMPDLAEQSRLLIDTLPHHSRVVVIGGDGTLNQLLPSLIAGEHTLALVPFGSGNDTARALGLYGLPWQQALQHGLSGAVSRIDIGLAEFQFEHAVDAPSKVSQNRSVPFISSFTTGFDSSIGLRAVNGPKWLRGLPRYLLATIRELANLRSWHIEVRVDAKVIHSGEALFASTLNTCTFGAGMPAVPHAILDDGKLDVLLAGKFNVFETLLMLPRLLIGKHLSHSKVRTQAFETMTISSNTPIPLAADGEYLGTTKHAKISVQPSHLSVVAATL